MVGAVDDRVQRQRPVDMMSAGAARAKRSPKSGSATPPTQAVALSP
jgi:hypothetical protein